MRTQVTTIMALCALAAAPALAGDGPTVPAGVRIRLEPDRTYWRVGENVIVRYIVENRSDEAFEADTGGDGRAIRPIRNLVEVYDASGALLEDPWPDPPCFGGPGGPVEVTVSRPLVIEIPVPRYRVFERAGTYRIRVLHDLGWGGKGVGAVDHWDMLERPGPDDPRWAETTVELLEPPPEAIDSVLDRMKELPRRGDQRWCERNRAWSDFETIRHPAYLSALTARARDRGGHEPEWITGLASIETPEATKALIELLVDDPSVKLAEVLLARVPAPEWIPGLIDYVSPIGPDPLIRDRMASGAWRPEFAEPLRAWARENLGGRYGGWGKYAAYFLAAVGTPDDLPALEKGLWANLQYFDVEPKRQADPSHRGHLLVLYQAAALLLRRGAPAPTAPKTSAEIALTLLAIRDGGPNALTPHADRLAEWLGHPEATIRDLTLRSLPRPLPEAALDALPALMGAEEVHQRITALQAIRETEDARFRPLVERELRRATDSWHLSQAEAAATAVGLDVVDRARIHVAHFDDEQAFRLRMPALISILTSGGWSSSGTPDAAERAKLKSAWTAFLDANAEALREGHRFGPDDSAVAPLIPSTVELSPPR